MSSSEPENLHASTNTLDIRKIVEEAKIAGLEFDAPSNDKVGDAPILDNGLNLLYAPQAYGKSYTAIAIAAESGLPSLFIDLESNGKMFLNHCKKNGVEYVYAGSAKDILVTVQDLVKEIKERFNKVLIIIDSYSDLFPDDEGRMAKDAQKKLGDMHKFFMRDVSLPILILDHATEQWNKDGMPTGFKIEGNKSGKYKKTVSVLRLDKINGDTKNGTFVTVERSRNQADLPLRHTKYYRRGNYITDKLQSLIDDKKLNEEFTAKDLEQCLSGDDRKQWRSFRNEIATSRKDRKSTFWKLNT